MHSLRSRILIFFTFFAIVAVVAVFMNSRSTSLVGDAGHVIANQHLPIVHAMAELELSLQRQDNAIYRYVATGNKQWLDKIELDRNNFSRWFLRAQSSMMVDSERDKLSDIDELYVQYENQTRQALLSGRRLSAEMAKMLEVADRYLHQMFILIDEIESLREGMTIVHQKQITQTLERNQSITFFFLISIVAVFGFLAFYLYHYLIIPLSLLQNGIRDFTRGKTDVVIPPIGKDELGELQEAFNEMSRELMTERKHLKAESQSDSLTGLFNMRYFRSQFIEEFSRSQRYTRPITVLMVDVDAFKAYNDRNGHPAGDIVLKEIARILIRNVRGTDIVARYGGEEFVVLLPETPLEAAATVAEKIRRTVEEHHFPFKGNTPNEKLSVSIGLSCYPDSTVNSDQELLEAADRALYAAKKAGRNRIFLSHKGDLRQSLTQLHAASTPKLKVG
jgi:diguanylate cyclase (GGDEF)-like protein